MPPNRDLRASDADREHVAAELGDHLAAGRLTTDEFSERVSSAYQARSLRDLDVLLTDLPAERERPGDAPPVSLEKAARSEPGPSSAGRPAPRFAPWLTVSLITLTVWAATSAAAGEFLDFWPMWVIGPWGLALLLGTCCGHGARRPRTGPG